VLSPTRSSEAYIQEINTLKGMTQGEFVLSQNIKLVKEVPRSSGHLAPDPV
jgi:hypothetical protein